MESDKDGWQGFIKLTADASDPDHLKELYRLFLTPEEINAINGRYRIIQELLKGEKSQRQIAKELGVSIAKITRGSNFLKTLNEDLRSNLKALLI